MNNNRVIKFRIWDINLNMFLTIKESDTFNLYYFLNRPNDFVVQQFTGLRDRNNKEIFEGDIVKGKYIGYNERLDNNYTKNYTSEVKFIRSAFCVFELGNIKNCWDELPHSFYKEDGEYIEIIGNIFETPDLLK